MPEETARVGDGSEAPVDRLMTAQEVARLLGVTPGWVYEQSRRGRLPTVVLGRYRRFRRRTVEEWIRSLEDLSVRG